MNGIEFSTKLWRRSQNSHATTIPKEILAIKDVPIDEEVEVKWRIDHENSGDVLVTFETEDDG